MTNLSVRGRQLAVIDVGCCNLGSVNSAIEATGYLPKTVNSPHEISLDLFEAIILPGSGNSATLAKTLLELRFTPMLQKLQSRRFPILGVCSGMHVLFEKTNEQSNADGENVETDCLGLISGSVQKISDGQKNINIGWHTAIAGNDKSRQIWTGINLDAKFFFMHGYGVLASPSNISNAYFVQLTGGHQVVAAIKEGSTVGLQFHPERSGLNGIKFLGDVIENLISPNL